MEYEPLIRLGIFFGVLLALSLWEALAPRRHLALQRGWRWASNLGLALLNTVVVRVAFTLGVVGVALQAHEQGWGLLNNVPLPYPLAVLLALLVLDLAMYAQHVLFHVVPLLWRLHRVHHADLDFDVTTGVRFHTLEIALSLAIKLAVVVALGAPPLAVLVFEIVLNATSLFNHSNIRMPAWLDRVLRLVVVTPDMHRVHHSAIRRETNSNFGFNLPWWDWLFRTYRDQPAAGHERMTIGLDDERDQRRVDRLWGMLLMPLSRPRRVEEPASSGERADLQSDDSPHSPEPLRAQR